VPALYQAIEDGYEETNEGTHPLSSMQHNAENNVIRVVMALAGSVVRGHVVKFLQDFGADISMVPDDNGRDDA
jgi:hypothetical protein